MFKNSDQVRLRILYKHKGFSVRVLLLGIKKTLIITGYHCWGRVKKIKLSEMCVQGVSGSETWEVKISDKNPIIDVKIA